MSGFDFAKLFPGNKARAEEPEEDDMDPAAAEDDSEPEDGDTPAEGEGDDGTEDEEDSGDGAADEKSAAEKAAYRRGAKAERKRIGTILSSEAAARNPAQAIHLACNTGLGPKEAAGILKAGPEAGGGSPLAQAMRGRGPRPLAVSAGGGGNDDDKAAARILAVAGNAKRKPKEA